MVGIEGVLGMRDRELDAWLAEHLLGWLRADQFDEIKALTKWAATDRTLQITIDRYAEQGLTMVAPDGRFAPVPDLTGSGDGMLADLEALTHRGYCPVLMFDDDGKWGLALSSMTHPVGLVVPEDDEMRWHESPPMAVALAAQAAIQAEGGRDA